MGLVDSPPLYEGIQDASQNVVFEYAVPIIFLFLVSFLGFIGFRMFRSRKESHEEL